MPKIIEHLREDLLAEAKKQLFEQGYTAMTIRSVANACGISVGTVYNYFPSKDMLVASFMLEDWQQCLERMEQGSLQTIYTELRNFVDRYEPLFKDDNASSGFAASFHQRHPMLRSQLARPLCGMCQQCEDGISPSFKAEFMAEALLTWTMEGRKFEELEPVFFKICN